MLDVYPISGISKNLSSLPVNAPYGGKPDGSMRRQMFNCPIMHRPMLSDPRHRVMVPDNYTVQRVGFVSCATADFHALSGRPSIIGDVADEYDAEQSNIHTLNANSKAAGSSTSALAALSKYFSVVCLPTFTTTEIHAALISGASVALGHGIEQAKSTSNMPQVLKPEIVELSRVILSAASKIVPANDASSTTNLEKSLRNMISLDIGMTAKYCMALGHGAPAVSNKGGLLELYTHEWERTFIDPLPSGKQRERMVAMFTNSLRDLDASAWYVSDEWLTGIISRIGTSYAPVWACASLVGASCDTFDTTEGADLDETLKKLKEVQRRASTARESSDRTNEPKGADEASTDIAVDGKESCETNEPLAKPRLGMYFPIIGSSPSSDLDNNDPSVKEEKVEKVLPSSLGTIGVPIDMSFLPDNMQPQVLIYPAAISFLLRLIRIIGTIKSHFLLSGFFGTTRLSALHVAARVCELDLHIFDAKESMGVTDLSVSEAAKNAVDFKAFLKRMIFKSGGFKERLYTVGNDDREEGRSSGISPSSPGKDRSSPSRGQGNPKAEKESSPADISKPKTMQRVVITDSQSTLVVICGAQQLNLECRRLLVHLLEYRDPCAILDDEDVLNIARALGLDNMSHALDILPEEVIKRQALAQANQKRNDMEQEGHTLTTNINRSTDNSDIDYDNARVSSKSQRAPYLASKFKASHSEPIGSLTSPEFNTSEGNVEKGDTDAGAIGGSATTALDADTVTKKANVKDDSLLSLTGYVLQWVKKRLQDSIYNGTMLVALDSDLPRALKLVRSNHGTISESLGLLPLTSSVTSSVGGNNETMKAKMRFTPLTQKEDNNVRDEGEELYVAQANLLTIEDVNKNKDDDLLGSRASAGAAKKNDQLDAATGKVGLHAQGIFTCPLLGPMLSRRFQCLWWEIDGVDATIGITNALLQPSPLTNQLLPRSSASALTPPVRTALATTDTETRGLCELSMTHRQVGLFYIGEKHNMSLTDADKDAERQKNIDKEVARALERTNDSQKQILKGMNLNLLMAFDCQKTARLYDFVSIFTFGGIFESFKTRYTEDTAHIFHSDTVKNNTAALFDEKLRKARVLLPQLMCMKTVSDALFLSEPFICAGPEKLSETAANLVEHVLRQACTVLF